MYEDLAEPVRPRPGAGGGQLLSRGALQVPTI